jgi:hypothetical protein
MQTLVAVLAGAPETDGLRSKRSRAYRTKAAVDADPVAPRTDGRASPALRTPASFAAKLAQLARALMGGGDDAAAATRTRDTVRALALDPHGAPLLQVHCAAVSVCVCVCVCVCAWQPTRYDGMLARRRC